MRICIKKASGKQQHKIWKFGELKTIEVEKQHVGLDSH